MRVVDGLWACVVRGFVIETMDPYSVRLGAQVHDSGWVSFLVWAPRARQVELLFEERRQSMPSLEDGYFGLWMKGPFLEPYQFSIDGGPPRPDPASRDLVHGVHGPSRVPVAQGSPKVGLQASLEDGVIYEVDIGTWTEEGTFKGALARLDDLVELGVTSVELMPVGEVGGGHNWGYDGVQPFCVRRAFGGAAGLRDFVEACHKRGLSVILDVVYNHLGPEGCYLSEFGPYFTTKHRTPWGQAINFASSGVRRFFIDHALECFSELGVDGLRLDSVVNLYDDSRPHFLLELSERAHALSKYLGRPLHLYAEADDNDPRWVHEMGCSAVWADDLHRSLHAYLTEERIGFYAPFGHCAQIQEAFAKGGVRKSNGDLGTLRPTQVVSFLQNHDVIGNRADGMRLCHLVSPPSYYAAVALALLGPTLPLLFMGQEQAFPSRYYFYTRFADPELGHRVRLGRQRQLRDFGFSSQPPDPQLPSTRKACIVGQSERSPVWFLHRDAIEVGKDLRKLGRPETRALGQFGFEALWSDGSALLAWMPRGEGTSPIDLWARSGGQKVFDSSSYLTEEWKASQARVVVFRPK